MKKLVFCFSMLILVTLCACTTTGGKENNSIILTSIPEDMVTPSTTPLPEPTKMPPIMPEETVKPTAVPTEKPTTMPAEKPTKMPAEAKGWYADEKTSIRNSNLLNGGYLTYDEDGNIYFADMNIGGIFVSDKDGKNRRQFSEQTARGMQIEGEWLYCIMEEGLKRVHIQTKEEEVLYDKLFGEVILANEKLYLNSAEGFISLDLDGSNKSLVRENTPALVSFAAGEDIWLGTAIDGENVQYFMEGHLYSFKEATGELSYVSANCQYPLLAGKWLSVFDLSTGTRQVWDLETDEKFDLGVYAQKAVSDGTNVYYAWNGGITTIYRWNGSEAEEIWRMENIKNMQYSYLTPETLYLMPEVYQDGKKMHQLWYYELETGKTGQIY